jgi:hypothetical protein
VVIFPARNIEIYIQNSQGYIFLILQHFSTKLCNQFTNFNIYALSSCGDGFCSSCLDQNLVYSWNFPLKFPYYGFSNEIANSTIYEFHYFFPAHIPISVPLFIFCFTAKTKYDSVQKI